ncbi:tail fiber domain-containing protein [Pseudoclavibacter sp. CFCC 14310]|uniref:tail fiber domain-containing protein n=1 Tax=Pseudoclavibacter sp. CFCC 14310 TaxID=2615180 RepID=UPI0013012C5F|nr:tail fiber domain-containing protein [Pseudoclavibacter sp. CFCC 14310]KAB1647466.1 tail fiber domain-containing protein [Pseudoclavibacter sp. CFCC 14310]
MADPQVPAGDLGDLRQMLRDLAQRLRELEKPSGSQFNQLVNRMLDIVNNIDTIVAGAIGRTSYSAAQIDSKDSSVLSQAKSYADGAAGAREPAFSVLSPGKGGTGSGNSYNIDLGSTTRRASWVSDAGVLGTALSSEKIKQDITPTSVTEADLRAARIVDFRYIAAVEAQGDAAPVEVGVIAEQVEGHVPDRMLYRDEEGAVVGFEYALSGVLAWRLGQIVADRVDALTATGTAQADLITDLSARIDALERGSK